MCGGAFGKFQNFRHNAQMGFGLIPENSLTGKRVQFERDAEDYVTSSEKHQSQETIKKRDAKAAAESAAKTETAKAETETLTKQSEKNKEDYTLLMRERANAATTVVSDGGNTKLEDSKTKTKTTLLGG